MAEPSVAVGLVSEHSSLEIVLRGAFELTGQLESRHGNPPPGRILTARCEGGVVRVEERGGAWQARGSRIELLPSGDPSDALFELRGMRIGLQFHWDQQQDLRFRGSLVLIGVGRDRVTAINRIRLEQYLISVISSEMSAASPAAMLEAHAVISRSWLMAQLESAAAEKGKSTTGPERLDRNGTIEIRRWYDRESHTEFDVCADDHCQRYQGADRAVSAAVVAAVEATAGVVLVHDPDHNGDSRICDARFSKCCGGMTERFDVAWGGESAARHPYLRAVLDAPEDRVDSPITLPLDDEVNANRFIRSSPDVWCRIRESASDLLDRVLPEIDQRTRSDLFRWQVTIEQEWLQEHIERKAGVDVGSVYALRALRRGASGRIETLRVEGTKCNLEIGKELEIRRMLSETHLLSSAFVVAEEGRSRDLPARFVIDGAGWGHGVGLCQIGAAAMADAGHDCSEILAHYYRGARLEGRYGTGAT